MPLRGQRKASSPDVISSGSRSTRGTRCPARATARAVERPAGPAPSTATRRDFTARRYPFPLVQEWVQSGRLVLQAGGDGEAGDHVVSGDGADELDDLIVGEDGADPLHRGGLDLDVVRHLVGESERGQLRLVEVLGVLERGRRVLEGGELLLRAACLEVLALVLEPLV